MKDKKDSNLTLPIITKLAEKITCFDAEVLKKIHEILPEDFRAFKQIVRCREDLFVLEELLWGLEIQEFATNNPGDER